MMAVSDTLAHYDHLVQEGRAQRDVKGVCSGLQIVNKTEKQFISQADFERIIDIPKLVLDK